MFYNVMLIICAIMALGCVYFSSCLVIWFIQDRVKDLKWKRFDREWEKEHQ